MSSAHQFCPWPENSQSEANVQAEITTLNEVLGFLTISIGLSEVGVGTSKAFVSFVGDHLPSHMRMHPCSVGKNAMHVPLMSFILMASSSILIPPAASGTVAVGRGIVT